MSAEDVPEDPGFFDRADAVLHLASRQLENVRSGLVSASTLYAAARVNAWVSATSFFDAEELERELEATVGFFVEQYRDMLLENLRDFAENFDACAYRTAKPAADV